MQLLTKTLRIFSLQGSLMQFQRAIKVPSLVLPILRVQVHCCSKTNKRTNTISQNLLSPSKTYSCLDYTDVNWAVIINSVIVAELLNPSWASAPLKQLLSPRRGSCKMWKKIHAVLTKLLFEEKNTHMRCKHRQWPSRKHSPKTASTQAVIVVGLFKSLTTCCCCRPKSSSEMKNLCVAMVLLQVSGDAHVVSSSQQLLIALPSSLLNPWGSGVCCSLFKHRMERAAQKPGNVTSWQPQDCGETGGILRTMKALMCPQGILSPY